MNRSGLKKLVTNKRKVDLILETISFLFPPPSSSSLQLKKRLENKRNVDLLIYGLILETILLLTAETFKICKLKLAFLHARVAKVLNHHPQNPGFDSQSKGFNNFFVG